MAEDERPAKRIVTAPGSTGPMSAGEVFSVELGPNEDVEWVWSHDRERGSSVIGFTIVPRVAAHRSAG
jgi:hypothetical protein